MKQAAKRLNNFILMYTLNHHSLRQGRFPHHITTLVDIQVPLAILYSRS